MYPQNRVQGYNFLLNHCRNSSQILLLPALRTRLVSIQPTSQLLKQISNALKRYNGKDHLCLHLCQNYPGLQAIGEFRAASTQRISIYPTPTCAPNHDGCQGIETSEPENVWVAPEAKRMEAAAICLRAALHSHKLHIAEQKRRVLHRYDGFKSLAREEFNFPQMVSIALEFHETRRGQAFI